MELVDQIAKIILIVWAVLLTAWSATMIYALWKEVKKQ